MCVTVVVKAMLYSANRPVLRSMHINRHIYSSSMQTFKHSYLTNGVLNQNDEQYCQKAKHSVSTNPRPVLGCPFFTINYLHTSKKKIIHDSRSNIDI